MLYNMNIFSLSTCKQKGVYGMDLKDVREALVVLMAIIGTFLFIIIWAKIKNKKND